MPQPTKRQRKLWLSDMGIFSDKNHLNEHMLPDVIPGHVAIIMDGNGRWAKRRGLPRTAGHSKGVKTFEDVVEMCFNAGVSTVTVYAFSTENWKRPDGEVKYILNLLDEYLDICVEKCLKKGIRMRIIGDRSVFPPEMIEKMNSSEQKTAHLNYNLNVAVNYGSRAEICNAVNALIAEGKTTITEEDISSKLYTAPVGDPDLIIRTGGEIRLSNYLMWQAAYSEFYFTDTFWPDFGKKDLYKAFAKFAKTHRRFGGL